MRLAPRTRRSARVSVAFLVFNLDGMGGTSRSTITQANALARRGNVGVRLVSLTRSADRPHYAIDPAVEVDYLVDARGEDPRAARPSRLIPARWDAQFSELTDDGLTALRSLDADIVVTVTPALMAAAVQLLPAGTRVVHQEHRSSADRGGGMEPLLAFAPRVAAVALLTRSSAAWLGAELGTSAPELLVMPNPLPVADQPLATLQSARIVAAGRIVAEKQFIHLLRAFEQIAADLPDWSLRILGDGPLRAELIAHAAKVGLAERVELPGAVPDMAPEWAAASICALSSSTEGFPLVAQEAMSAGVPVVSYDCPSGPRELVEHGVSGLLVGAGSKAGLAAALHRVAADPDLRSRLGAGALTASRRYDAGVLAAEWESIFQRISMGHPVGDTPQKTPGSPMDIPAFSREGMPVEVPPITPRQARRQALSLAVAAADASGPGWFVIPTHDNPTPTVVVPAEHRAAVLERLAEVPDHFSLLDPGDRGWPSRRLPARDLVDALHGAAPIRVVLEPWPRSKGAASVLGHDAGVDIEFWDALADGTLVAPRRNRWTPSVPAGTPLVDVDVEGLVVPTVELMAAPTAFDVDFPIDVVYTWVDGEDPDWNAARTAREGADSRREASGQARFRSRDELRYSLRSLHLFAPWVRHIHLVTAGQRPAWLADDPRITLVDHRDLLPADALPTFNSQAIETALHQIPGLSEHFIYLNDDVFLARATRPELFFTPGGAPAAFVADAPIGLGGASSKPFVQAALNNRALLAEEFGAVTTQVMAHSPHPHRVSLLREIESRFPDAIARTAHAPFRSETDVSLLSNLAQHYGLLTGRAVVATARHAFVDLSNARIARQLRQLRARDHDFFCVGDHHDFAVDADAVDAMLAEFLAAYFPLAAPWEL